MELLLDVGTIHEGYQVAPGEALLAALDEAVDVVHVDALHDIARLSQTRLPPIDSTSVCMSEMAYGLVGKVHHRPEGIRGIRVQLRMVQLLEPLLHTQ